MKNGAKTIFFLGTLIALPIFILSSEQSFNQHQSIGHKRKLSSSITSSSSSKKQKTVASHEDTFTVGIIGATGNVGKTIANNLLTAKIPSELILWGRDKNKCLGEAADLNDGTDDGIIKVADNIHGVANADVIIITAGVAQQPGGQTRDELLTTNALIISDFIKQLSESQNKNNKAVILMVTNPVEDLAHVAYTSACIKKYLENPSQQVIGSGTSLDTRRLRNNLAANLHLDKEEAQKVYVLGEHGDKQVVAWSHAHTQGLQLEEKQKQEIEKATRDKAYKIIDAKGYTQFGVARCITEICLGIKEPQSKYTVPLSVYNQKHKVYLSQLARVGKAGLIQIYELEDMHLNQDELTKLDKCITKRKNNLIVLQKVLSSTLT